MARTNTTSERTLTDQTDNSGRDEGSDDVTILSGLTNQIENLNVDTPQERPGSSSSHHQEQDSEQRQQIEAAAAVGVARLLEAAGRAPTLASQPSSTPQSTVSPVFSQRSPGDYPFHYRYIPLMWLRTRT